MEYAALALSVVAVLIASGSLWYARRADGRAAEIAKRDTQRFDRERADVRVGALERVGEVVREFAAASNALLGGDATAISRSQSARARLLEAIEAAPVDLPACRQFADHGMVAGSAEAEAELERAIAAIRDGAA